MHNEIGKKSQFTLAVIAIAAASLLQGTTAISTIITPENAIAYESNQAKSDINECGNGFEPTNIGCQNIDSQIQGDRNSVALSSQQTFPSQELPPPPETATLTVITIVQCAAGQQCPGLPAPSDFTMRVVRNFLGEQIIHQFPVSADGTTVTLEPGEYGVFELIPGLPPGIDVSVRFSAECFSSFSGPIQAGEERTCTVTNTIIPVAQTP